MKHWKKGSFLIFSFVSLSLVVSTAQAQICSDVLSSHQVFWGSGMPRVSYERPRELTVANDNNQPDIGAHRLSEDIDAIIFLISNMQQTMNTQLMSSTKPDQETVWRLHSHFFMMDYIWRFGSSVNPEIWNDPQVSKLLEELMTSGLPEKFFEQAVSLGLSLVPPPGAKRLKLLKSEDRKRIAALHLSEFAFSTRVRMYQSHFSSLEPWRRRLALGEEREMIVDFTSRELHILIALLEKIRLEYDLHETDLKPLQDVLKKLDPLVESKAIEEVLSMGSESPFSKMRASTADLARLIDRYKVLSHVFQHPGKSTVLVADL